MDGNYGELDMVNKIKVICISLSICFLVNVFVFGALTLVQAPYYSDAPDEIASVYDAIANEEYKQVVCHGGDEGFSKGGSIALSLENLSVKKINPIKSYFVLLTCNKDDYVLYAYNWLSPEDRVNAKDEFFSDLVVVYTKQDAAYFVFKEFTDASYSEKYDRVAVYELNDSESIKLLNSFKNDSVSPYLFPEWRSDISSINTSIRGKLYVSSVVVELIVAMIVVTKVFESKKRHKNKKIK